MINYTHVIWDWNGTLLDDFEWCISRINIMLRKRGLPILDSVESYHNVFGFPVREYYQRVGFDFEKEQFERLAIEYIDLYHSDDNSVALFPEAKKILTEIQQNGIHQVILSASEMANLVTQMKPFNINTYFDEILGISDIYATSKTDMGKEYMLRAKPKNAVLIGDTTHDKEVADALGIECILVANGHQSKNTLLSCGAVVVDDLMDIKSISESERF